MEKSLQQFFGAPYQYKKFTDILLFSKKIAKNLHKIL